MLGYFVGQIVMGGFASTPKDFAACDGQEMDKDQSKVLFSLLGHQYGGAGQTFRLPDLRGRAPICASKNYAYGASGGAERVSLGVQHLPSHSHAVRAITGPADFRTPTYPARTDDTVEALYAPATGQRVNLAYETIASTGAGASIENMQPFCAVPFAIALTGIYPTRP